MASQSGGNDDTRDPGDYPYAVQRAGKRGKQLYDALERKLTAAGLDHNETAQWIALNFDAVYAAMTRKTPAAPKTKTTKAKQQ